MLDDSPDYLERPRTPDDLARHEGLWSIGWTGPWRLSNASAALIDVHPTCRLRCDNGEVVHDWGLQGRGIMLKSAIDVSGALKLSGLERVLPE